ncbi:NACHT, LRR and PYD domains-containing protein 12 [Xenopus laevis]|uniref:NACHT, LRR and PYD domains-containing protein 12 n=2 Tax=Xenopus laevis TaxID=8355 RepID=A0A1L8FCP4_XENLA|nr:NACHT, LRR and PYD domains-containing protein 12 [Xenopus laevis]OCT69359.1 hypothetical protein XELAEV_18040674mg [Xenopus laevis]
MDEFRGRVINQDDVEIFRGHLSQYEMHQLGILYEHFRDDLVYIIESVDTLSILRELSFREIVSVQHYVSLKKECGATVFAEMLVEDILSLGRDAVLGFWESLYVLQNDHPHPNLLGVLDEIIQRGETLEQHILLDHHGHDLPEELTACQMEHKQYLLEKTQSLEELRVPGSSQKPQSFHISERYLDLIVASGHQFRERTQHEVIETGGKHEHYLQKAHSNLERIAPNRLFRWCHRLRCIPHAVIVSGVPGVGKTTLMQKFVYDWLAGKLYQRFAFVFFFKFRTLNTKEAVSLQKIILDEYPHLRKNLSEILQDPQKLLFIFDGLDESAHQIEFQSTELCVSPHSLNRLDVIVVSLVRQSLLKGCSVLMTSRPTRLASIDTKVFPRVCEIMGFFPKQREMYFQHFFGNQVISNKAFHYVRENGVLYTFCYIPSYCWIICTVLSMCFKDNDQSVQLLPKTVTQLFVIYVTNILSNHSQDSGHAKELLTSVGWMAEHGVMSHYLEFEEQDLATFHVNNSSKLLSSFMVESAQSHGVIYSFFHLTIQEFLAALVHYLDFSAERLKEAFEKAQSFEDGRGEIFIRFISGLSDMSTRSQLKPYFGDLSSEASKHVIALLNDMSSSVTSHEDDGVDKRKTLNVYACLSESRNKALVSETIGKNTIFDLSEFHLAPLDCTVLSFILESFKEVELLDLDACFIQTEGLERLAPTLHKIKDLSLSQNNMRDEDLRIIYSTLTHPDCKIHKLSLRENGLTEESCTTLAWAIKENKTLRDLDLSKNKLAGEYFYQLLMVLSDPTCKIERLGLMEIKLTPDYAPSLHHLTGNTNLTHLNLSYNFLSDTSFSYIRDLILNSLRLKEIRLGTNDFSEEVVAKLRSLQTQRPAVNIEL